LQFKVLSKLKTTTMQTPPPLPQQKTKSPFAWATNSVTLKIAIVLVLALVLLVPSSMIENIIEDRQTLSKEAQEDINAKWAGNQELTGPILTVPIVFETNGIFRTKELKLLPNKLDIKGSVFPETRERGIYSTVVYKSNLQFNGNFDFSAIREQKHIHKILWDEAQLSIGVTDLKGIEEAVVVNWNGQLLEAKPGSAVEELFSSGVVMNLPVFDTLPSQKIPFQLDLKLQGGQHLSFIPTGNTTTVAIDSKWQTPSFVGNFLPDNHTVNNNGFSADWKVLQLNRNFPQFWFDTGHEQELWSSGFGVTLLMAMDDYQKSTRSVKYAVLTIALTFLIFFLVELLNDKKIHPFQYGLVGLALVLFYVLLVSISEHLSFDLAYGISTLAIVLMIALYSLSIFKAGKLTFMLAFALFAVYGFLFVILQLSDYALLMGSVGLTIILAVAMYFTRKVNWYKAGKAQQTIIATAP